MENKSRWKILRYRFTAWIYPHLFMEAEVSDDDGVFYVSMDVNSRGEKIDRLPGDSYWAFTCPIEEVEDDPSEQTVCGKDLLPMLDAMLKKWNEDPRFDAGKTGLGQWRPWAG